MYWNIIELNPNTCDMNMIGVQYNVVVSCSIRETMYSMNTINFQRDVLKLQYFEMMFNEIFVR